MKRNRLILFALYTAIGLGFSGISFSLAWYGSSTNLRITTIDISLDADRDLKIATSHDGNYVQDLTEADFPSVGSFTPVTTTFSSSWIEQGQEKPTFYDLSYASIGIETGVGEVTSRNEAIRGFFCQDVYLSCDDDVYVGLDVSSDATYFRSNKQKNATYAASLYAREGEYTQEEYETRLNDVQYSGRIALLDPERMDFTIVDPYKGEDKVYFGGALDNDADGYYDFYQTLDNDRKEVFYGECDKPNNLVYEDALKVDANAEGELTSFNAGHKAGVKRLNIEKSIENGADITVENSTSPALLEAEEELGKLPDFYVEVEANKPKRLNLNFYLEGWDPASINGTMGGAFDMKVTFKILRER
ncbi:MAG: hypothetical protein K6B65_01445 [Bacilli bacterium]|nr:hypothetical protein [Bacilli bacterium]